MALNINKMVDRWKRRCFKAFLKRLPRERRPLRIVMRGRRLLAKQYQWLNFTKHPWEK